MRRPRQSNQRIGPLLIPAIVAILLKCAVTALAEPPQPFINYIFPAGGQRGKTVEVTITGGGTNALTGSSAVRITGPGVTAKVVQVVNVNTVLASVTIAPDAELGDRDFRLISPGGISNRLRFEVGSLPEINEAKTNTQASTAQRLESLPVVVNGQIMESNQDFYRFAAKAGQTVVCDVLARGLRPYIADAVPGWLDACLTLYDPTGKKLEYAEAVRHRLEPLLVYNVERDGEYTLEIRDVIYRGRGYFVYRLTIGTQPCLTHVFPLGGQRNTATQVELHGFNVPVGNLNFSIPVDSPPVRPVSFVHDGLTSNPLPFAVGDAKEAREVEPNNSLAQANRVETPAAVNGRIQNCGDVDYVVFGAQAGQRLIMEVHARRLDSPLDAILSLFNANGQLLAENDDLEDKDRALLTHHADSRLDYTFPAAGDYTLKLRDVAGQGGEAYAYRLVIAPPRLDYTLLASPDNPRVGQGSSALIAVNALRKDGFNEEINLAVENLPPGFTATDALILAGQAQAHLTITAPRDAPMTILTPTIVGTAKLGNETLVRKALGVETVMQAFSYTHNVPTKEFLLAVIEPPSVALSLSIPPKQVLEIRQGGEVQVAVKAARKAGVKGGIDLSAMPAQAGISVKTQNIPAEKDEIAVTVSVPAQAPVGFRQNIILTGILKLGAENITNALPAIPIKVVAPPK